MLETPLAGWHREHEAKMAPFAGWDMPIQYDEGIIAEHNHTRKAASVFDICHMGQLMLRGRGAKDMLSRAVTQDLETLAVGKCRYGFLLNEGGGVIDDLIVYRLGEEHFLLVVNAACTQKDLAVLKARTDGKTEDISQYSAKIDLQGPQSREVLRDVLGEDIGNIKYFSFCHTKFMGGSLTVSRTGYTGELGYELYPPRHLALPLWETLLKDKRVKPAGLGARDTLRLESGLSLYGHELDESHTPAEAGLAAMLRSPAGYAGKEGAPLVKNELLVPLSITGRRTARNGDAVRLPGTDEIVGRVTSGSFAPSLGHAIAFAYVRKDAAANEEFELISGKASLRAVKTTAPFYKEGTARIALS